MCGIFGQIASDKIDKHLFDILVDHSEQRGKDSSGLLYYENSGYKIIRSDYSIRKLVKEVSPYDHKIVLGHSRLITNGLADNQPVIGGDISVVHNGIIVNEESIWNELSVERKLQIDTEAISACAEEYLDNGGDVEKISEEILRLCKGVIACALALPSKGKLILFSNNGSLYIGDKNSDLFFASESYGLSKIGCNNITQIKDKPFIIDIPLTDKEYDVVDIKSREENLIPEFRIDKSEEQLLEFKKLQIKRCTRCILPETMPFINFDEEGVCNYCKNYKIRNKPKPASELFELVAPYRRKNGLDCIVPFSGGRDSSFGLHLIIKELKMNPLTYTYDWGMMTDLGRRNISIMCAELGVENIIVAADISKKRKNIRMNLDAWLKSPHLGMMALLTAGDKHFFRHIENIKYQTGVDLNLWGINPLEVTHFKTGFLGIPPDFEEKRVYSHGAP